MITIITVSEETLLYRANSLTERERGREFGKVQRERKRERQADRQTDRQRDQNA